MRSGRGALPPAVHSAMLEFADVRVLAYFLALALRALVLAGGYGTRLGRIGQDRSKVLLPVAGRPVIDHVLERLAELPQISETVVVTNARFHPDFAKWAAVADCPFKLTVLNDGTTGADNRLGAVGDVLFGIEQTGLDDELLVMAGDNLCDFPLERMAETLRTKGTCIALFDVGRVEEASKFNNLSLAPDGQIVEFQEKPRVPTSSLVAVAIYMLRRSDVLLFRRFRDEGNDLDLLGGFVQWAHRQVPIYTCIFDQRFHWWDIGDPEVYDQVSRHYERVRRQTGAAG